MTVLEQARQMRAAMNAAGVYVPDEGAVAVTALFPPWEPGVDYTAGDRIRYADLLYRVITGHKSQADWTPTAAVSLFVRMDDPAIEWPDWRQPAGAQGMYQIGDKVTHKEKHWISNTPNNVWEPGVYGWGEA